MGLDGHEREQLSPATSTRVNTLLAAALDKAVPEAVTLWMVESRIDPPSTARINNTLALLAANPALGHRFSGRIGSSVGQTQPSAEDEYLQLVRNHFHTAGANTC
jgi:hypothetical protein